VNAGAVSWVRRKLNAFKLLANRLLDKIICAGVSGKQIRPYGTDGVNMPHPDCTPYLYRHSIMVLHGNVSYRPCMVDTPSFKQKTGL